MDERPPDFLEHFDPNLMMRASAYAIIASARLEGLKIAVSDDDVIHIWGSPGLRDRWRPLLTAKKAEVIEELRFGICDRCGERGRRLAPSWWGEHEEQVCGVCALLVTNGLGVDE